MKNLILVFAVLFMAFACGNPKQTETTSTEPEVETTPVEEVETNEGKALVKEMVAAIGGVEALYAKKDVEYTYTYNVPAEGKKDVSKERYVFDGELSWAAYETHEKFVSPGYEGTVYQGYDGKNFWVKHDDEVMEDEQMNGLSSFMRKTNYYWFNMMFKLLDPGLVYEYKGTKEVDSVNYEIVRVTFEENVGVAQDIYELYINPETKLVDQFLFTVQAFGVTDPLLMKVKYEEVDGLMLTTYRKYAPANWEGEVIQEAWAEEISEDVKFNNGFTTDQFSI